MARTAKDAKAKAEQDAELAAALAERDEEPEEAKAMTIADQFVAMNALIIDQKNKTRLSEATLIKTFEMAMNYQIWQIQREEAAAQRNFDPASTFLNQDQEVPEPNERIEAADDNVVAVNFTPEDPNDNS